MAKGKRKTKTPRKTLVGGLGWKIAEGERKKMTSLLSVILHSFILSVLSSVPKAEQRMFCHVFPFFDSLFGIGGREEKKRKKKGRAGSENIIIIIIIIIQPNKFFHHLIS